MNLVEPLSPVLRCHERPHGLGHDCSGVFASSLKFASAKHCFFSLLDLMRRNLTSNNRVQCPRGEEAYLFPLSFLLEVPRTVVNVKNSSSRS